MLPTGRRVCELRLLAVEPAFRTGPVFRGLVETVVREGRAEGYDLAIISGTTRQTKLYRHLGFEPFGPLVGTEEAPFQPMFLTFERFLSAAPKVVTDAEPMSFLPGPVPIAPDVRAAFEQAARLSPRRGVPAVRSAGTKSRLCRLTGAERVEILLGTGTLANDAVAAQLSLLESPGVVLSNGEFGRRLIDHARRHRLPHVAVESAWGSPLDLDGRGRGRAADRRDLGLGRRERDVDRHAERSDGAEDVRAPRTTWSCASTASARLAPFRSNLDGVYLASGASGKALASYPGPVLRVLRPRHRAAARSAAALPRPRLLRVEERRAVHALVEPDRARSTPRSTASTRTSRSRKLNEFANRCGRVCARLGWAPLVDGPLATPAVVTVALTNGYRASEIGEVLARQGLVIAHHSEYLAERNWFQVSLMGHRSAEPFECLLAALGRLVHH